MVTFCCWCSQNLFHFSGLLLDDPPVFPFLTRTFYGYIWSGLLWSTTWLHLLQSLDLWREEKSWEEDRRRIKECSQAKTDRELLREVKINVLDIECRTCFFSLQDSGESCWPERYYGWTRGATIKNKPIFYQVREDVHTYFFFIISAQKVNILKVGFYPDASMLLMRVILLMRWCCLCANATLTLMQCAQFFKRAPFLWKYERNTSIL